MMKGKSEREFDLIKGSHARKGMWQREEDRERMRIIRERRR